MTATAGVTVLADHPIWLAVPAFAPAIVVAAVVVVIAVRNRRRVEPGHPEGPCEGNSRARQDGSP